MTKCENNIEKVVSNFLFTDIDYNDKKISEEQGKKLKKLVQENCNNTADDWLFDILNPIQKEIEKSNKLLVSIKNNPPSYYEKEKRELELKRKVNYCNSMLISVQEALLNNGRSDIFDKYFPTENEAEIIESEKVDNKNKKFNISWNLKTDSNPDGFSQNDLLEMIKALVEAKAINGTQKDIIACFAYFLNVEIKNPDQSLQSIKNHRNKETETKFLDTIKASLSDWINKPQKK